MLTFDQLINATRKHLKTTRKSYNVNVRIVGAYQGPVPEPVRRRLGVRTEQVKVVWGDAVDIKTGSGERRRWYVRFDDVLPTGRTGTFCWCECPAFTFQSEWVLWKAGSSQLLKAVDRPPDKTNPKRQPWVCKHLAAALPQARRLTKISHQGEDRWKAAARAVRRWIGRPVDLFSWTVRAEVLLRQVDPDIILWADTVQVGYLHLD